ncbi:MAG: fibronectin type III domain-containing protein [Saprospiraceae bacterium]|nr:fibronectin type III domain-containing protein [Saprospiraceae bacterium]
MILIPHRAIRLVLFLLFAIQFCQARSTRFRVMWRTNPATSMVIGWDQVSGSNPRLYYDTQDLGVESNKYAFSEPPHQITEAKMMRNHFVRLQNLKPNTVYYFLVVDSEGSSQRYSFKTAPDTPDQPLAIIAGGDSRNYRAARRFANRMVSKIRPDLVLFAGDMTGGDSGPEWSEWLTDWLATIGADGRIFPIVVARGNHESSNRTLSQIFDVPTTSVYYGLTFGESLIRIYTLNSMIAVGGDQKTWL